MDIQKYLADRVKMHSGTWTVEANWLFAHLFMEGFTIKELRDAFASDYFQVEHSEGDIYQIKISEQ